MASMKFGLLAAAGLLAFTSLASAADMAVKAPPPPAPVFSWTGFYIGGHAGGGWGTAESTLTGVRTNFECGSDLLLAEVCIGNRSISGLGIPISQTQENGFLGGVQAGYNVQATSWLVLGIEGEFSWTDIKGTSPCILIFACSVKHDWMATAAGRVGFTYNRLMFFFKGGAAWSEAKYTASLNIGDIQFGPIQSGSTSVKNTRVGALFGTGIEYAFFGNWSAKIEYNYIDFGRHNHTFSIFDGDILFDTSIHERIHTVKGGLNWRFNSPGLGVY
jgi:outer membrane immunogenic protein